MRDEGRRMKIPELQWDETDFVWYLEVAPKVTEYDTEHFFEVQ
jgi:hypothetical protein